MLNNEQTESILRALQAGNKLGAVKLYKEFANCSLKVAKQHVEQIQQTGQVPGSVFPETDGFQLDDDQMDGILDAIEAGSKIDAVKIYRDATGSSLKDSKLAIEELMSQLELTDPEAVGKPGCSAMIWFLFGLGLIGAYTIMH